MIGRGPTVLIFYQRGCVLGLAGLRNIIRFFANTTVGPINSDNENISPLLIQVIRPLDFFFFQGSNLLDPTP